jgi:hypothetical protein
MPPGSRFRRFPQLDLGPATAVKSAGWAFHVHVAGYSPITFRPLDLISGNSLCSILER